MMELKTLGFALVQQESRTLLEMMYRSTRQCSQLAFVPFLNTVLREDFSAAGTILPGS
jgi:hypothetical protein